MTKISSKRRNPKITSHEIEAWNEPIDWLNKNGFTSHTILEETDLDKFIDALAQSSTIVTFSSRVAGVDVGGAPLPGVGSVMFVGFIYLPSKQLQKEFPHAEFTLKFLDHVVGVFDVHVAYDIGWRLVSLKAYPVPTLPRVAVEALVHVRPLLQYFLQSLSPGESLMDITPDAERALVQLGVTASR